MGDIALIRGASLTGYRGLVAEVGADPDSLLHAAGIDPAGAGQHDVFLGYRAVVLAVEGSPFAGLVDKARRERAEQSVLTRACQRWFGCGSSAYRESAPTIWSTAARS